jgi:hypothetical protein
MANIGSFDPELRPVIWFDRTILPEGWFEYSLNFDDPNIGTGAAAAAPIPDLSLIVLQSVSNAATF